jgi:hypothetical protein
LFADEQHEAVRLALRLLSNARLLRRSQHQPGMKPCCQSRNAAQAFCQTACSFEKNYRLQDIQLSKIRLRPRGLRRSQSAAAPTSFGVIKLLILPRVLAFASSARFETLVVLVADPSRPACALSGFGGAASACWRARRAVARSRVTRAEAGGEYRARTGDLLVANQALSQLS